MNCFTAPRRRRRSWPRLPKSLQRDLRPPALLSSEICTRGVRAMSHRGFSHIGLSTLDLDKTREFYEGVLGFTPVFADTIKIKEGGRIRHIFFNTGRDQLLAFMEARGVPGVPIEYDTGINRGL